MSTWKETKRRRKQKARELAEVKRRAQRPTEQEMWEARQAAIWADRDAALREDMERGREYATRISGPTQPGPTQEPARIVPPPVRRPFNARNRFALTSMLALMVVTGTALGR